MAAKQASYTPYRRATAPDPAFPAPPAPPFTAEQKANYLLDTKPFDGVHLLCSYASGTGAAGYTLEVWFYNRTRDEFYQDVAQTIVVNEQGLKRHEVVTQGETVLLRVARLDGAAPVLSIEAGVFSQSKI